MVGLAVVDISEVSTVPLNPPELTSPNIKLLILFLRGRRAAKMLLLFLLYPIPSSVTPPYALRESYQSNSPHGKHATVCWSPQAHRRPLQIP